MVTITNDIHDSLGTNYVYESKDKKDVTKQHNLDRNTFLFKPNRYFYDSVDCMKVALASDKEGNYKNTVMKQSLILFQWEKTVSFVVITFISFITLISHIFPHTSKQQQANMTLPFSILSPFHNSVILPYIRPKSSPPGFAFGSQLSQ